MKQKYTLDFGSFLYYDGIFEAIINEGVELDESKIDEFFNLILSLETKPSLVLVNRINTYSYTFKANIKLATSSIIKHIAVVKYGRLPWPLKGIFTPKFYGLAFFDNRNLAIDWLNSKK